MTYPELRDKCIELQRDCTEKQNELRRQYAAEHNPVKVGDIITDHYHTIRVENMSMYGHPVPYVRYTGIELTKQGEQKKRQPIPRNPVYQCDIRTINGESYKWKEAT